MASMQQFGAFSGASNPSRFKIPSRVGDRFKETVVDRGWKDIKFRVKDLLWKLNR